MPPCAFYVCSSCEDFRLLFHSVRGSSYSSTCQRYRHSIFHFGETIIYRKDGDTLMELQSQTSDDLEEGGRGCVLRVPHYLKKGAT